MNLPLSGPLFTSPVLASITFIVPIRIPPSISHNYRSGFRHDEDLQAKFRDAITEASKQIRIHLEVWERDGDCICSAFGLSKHSRHKSLGDPMPCLSRRIRGLRLPGLRAAFEYLGWISLHFHDKELILSPRFYVGTSLTTLGIRDLLNGSAVD